MIFPQGPRNFASTYNSYGDSAPGPDLLNEIVPQAYALTIKRLDICSSRDMSRMNMCAQLTEHLLSLLHIEGVIAQREKHESTNDSWHVLVTYGGSPSTNELVTDLCPWQFTPSSEVSGFYHGTRINLQRALYENGATAESIGLIGVSTIIKCPYTE